MSNAPEVMSPYFHNPQRDDIPRIVSPCPRLRPDLYGERMFEFEKEMLSAIKQMQKDIAEIKEYIQSKEKSSNKIIRCRNCVNQMRSPDHDWCYVHAFPIKLDDFCSYAVRREGDHERTE